MKTTWRFLPVCGMAAMLLLPQMALSGEAKTSSATSALIETPTLEKGVPAMPRYIIRVLPYAHCKRGPAACEKCRAGAGAKISLLDISPPNQGMVQRRVTEVTIDGKKSWREFDVVRTFADEAEARAYASANGITDLEFTPPDSGR